MTQEHLRHKYDIREPDCGPWFAFELFELAKQYAKDIRYHEYGIASYLRQRGMSIMDDEAEEAWWLLMLRGITWTMATRSDTDLKAFGEFIPSSFYDNKTPIWIT